MVVQWKTPLGGRSRVVLAVMFMAPLVPLLPEVKLVCAVAVSAARSRQTNVVRVFILPTSTVIPNEFQYSAQGREEGVTLGHSAAAPAIPKGFKHSAQGCEARATLGDGAKKSSTPTGL